jgi:hypothetical protein
LTGGGNLKIIVLAVPEKVEKMKVTDFCELVGKILPNTFSCLLPAVEETSIEDYLPMEITLHDGDLLESLTLLSQLGFTVQGSKDREFNPLFSLTVH